MYRINKSKYPQRYALKAVFLIFRGRHIRFEYSLWKDDESPNLIEGTEYIIEYENNNAPGTATAVLKGIGNYTGELRIEYTISELDPWKIDGEFDLEQAVIELSDEYSYDGEEKKPKPIVNYKYVVPETGYKKDFVLEEGEDYTLSYEDNVNAGTGSVIRNPMGKSVNGNKGDFNISTADLSDVSAQDILDQLYTGYEVEPELSLFFNGMNLVKDTDYEVIFENNDGVGTATATIYGIGNYSGEISKDCNWS